jgi:hypothetical protein
MKEWVWLNLNILSSVIPSLRFSNNCCYPDPVKLYLIKKIEYIEQMNQLYKTTSIPQVTPASAGPSDILSNSSNDLLPPSTSEIVPSLCQPSPFSFSPHLHRILGWPQYVHTKDKDLKGGEVGNEHENFWSNSMVKPPEALDSKVVNNSENVGNSVSEGGNHEENCNDYDKNQVPNFLEYSGDKVDKAAEIVVSEGNDKEEVDELNLIKYESLSMVEMWVNANSDGYYKLSPDVIDVVDDTAQIDVDNRMSEAVVDEDFARDKTEISKNGSVIDKILVKMEVDGETCLFSWAAIAELHLLQENVRLRGEEIDEELGEFSEEQKYGDMLSTVVVTMAPVASPSQLQRGWTGGNSKWLTSYELRKYFSWTWY